MIAGRLLFSLVILVTLSATATRAANVEVTEAWARATPGASTTGAAYLTIINHGPDDAIIGALSAAAERTELHNNIMDGDVMRMRPVESIDLPSGATVTLAPGGLHVMLMGLTAPLAEGAWFPLSLELASGGTVNATVTVAGVGAMGPADQAHHGHHE